MKLGSRINSSTYWDNFIDRKIPSNKTKYEESTSYLFKSRIRFENLY